MQIFLQKKRKGKKLFTKHDSNRVEQVIDFFVPNNLHKLFQFMEIGKVEDD